MDRYIDNDETQVYGPQFSANLRRMFGGSTPADRFMQWCAEQLDASTNTMRDAMAAQRAAGSSRTGTSEEKAPVVVEARDEIRAFALHLAACKADRAEPWKGDPELFVPGGIGALPRSARGVHVALQVACKALEADSAAPDRAKWRKRLDAQRAALAPLVERADEAQAMHRGALSEQSSEKRAWLRTYRGIALVLEGVLLLTGRELEYTTAVPHLTAPGTRKKTDGNPNVPARPSQPVPPS